MMTSKFAIGYFAIGLVLVGMANALSDKECGKSLHATEMLAAALIWPAAIVTLVSESPETKSRASAQLCE